MAGGRTFPEHRSFRCLPETFSWSLPICILPFNTLLPGLEGCHFWRAPVGFGERERNEDREFVTPAAPLQGHQGLAVSLYPQLRTVRQPSPHCCSLGFPTLASPGVLQHLLWVSINPAYAFVNKRLNSPQVIQGETSAPCSQALNR